MKAPRDPVAYLEALKLMLTVAYANVRKIQDDTPVCTTACACLGDALVHLEDAAACIGAARLALLEKR